MWFGLLTLFTAIAIAGVAAWFSIVGLMIFFSGSATSIAVMAGTLEVGKLLTASWLYRYWNETSFALKAYLSSAVLILMLITSMGIFGYLSKAASEVSADGQVAFAEVDRIEGQIAREENKIDILEDRILSIGGSVDISESIKQQETIKDGAWDRVQGDIDFANGQIVSLRAELTTLNEAVNELRNKGVEVVTLDEGGAFRQAETEKIDYVAQANQLFEQQQPQREQIQRDIKTQQDNIDNYRAQAQKTIDDANKEINRLRNSNQEQQDDNLIKIDDFNGQIDAIYSTIATLKDEKFQAESKVRDLEREVGPIKYVAELLYGSSEQSVMDQAVRIFILLLVIVFDPLAVMLIIAANQTLLRYGINLEKGGPDDDGSNGRKRSTNEITGTSDVEGADIDREESASSQSESQRSGDQDISVRLKRQSGESGNTDSDTKSNDLDQKKNLKIQKLEKQNKDLKFKYQTQLDELNDKYKSTLKNLKDVKNSLDEKPKEVIIEKEVEVIKEVPVEVEKIVEIEKKVEVPKEVVVTREVEVPGPERIIEVPGPERLVVKTDNSKIDELSKVNTKLQNDINELHTQLQEKPKEIEKAASGDLREAARLMAQSELNKEDLSEDDIYEMLQKSSEEDVKRKIGFWAMPLPTDDTEPKDTNKRYIGKA